MFHNSLWLGNTLQQEERLTVNIEILIRIELEEILAMYKEYKVDYAEVRALYLVLKDKVDLIEGEELERDIRIIDTHWVNVYELLIAAFAVVSRQIIRLEFNFINERSWWYK